ncbi:MAG TPA: sigma-70 family RNA polymerase sigma factor [Thermoanaerobaculia bacterium]|nr:sigma-70 family RNA polymerase sigma factor [Thermoanaerobaculia bacterium]
MRVEDDLLVVRCQLGEREAFEELIARWHEPLWMYVRRLTASDDTAADVVQETWLRVVRAIARLREPGSLRAWLFGIARRAVMDRLRVRYREPTVPLDDVDVAADVVADELDLQALHAELEALPLLEREVLVLFYLRELTLQELSEILEAPLGTIKSRLFRARNTLRRQLEAKGWTR